MNPDHPSVGTPKSRATIERLFAATIGLIAELGWDNASSRRVADRAGVSLGVVHYHFDSIEDLRRQAAVDLIERFFSEATSFAAASGEGATPTPAVAIRQLFTALATGDPNRTELNVLYQSLVAAVRDDRLRAELAAQLAEYRAFAEAWLADLGVANAKRVAFVIVAAVDGYVLQRSLDPDLDPDVVADGLVQLASSSTDPDTPVSTKQR